MTRYGHPDRLIAGIFAWDGIGSENLLNDFSKLG
ncbi:uncharacterized protein METZ01_LOCUS94246 [marine metagenome]|uniref:Uncharacterized protein n=1 Tax=marine metagenome TaxID=408172 RepID=A0A381VM84_9ZZZZ